MKQHWKSSVSAPSVPTPKDLEKEATEAGKEYVMKHSPIVGHVGVATCVFSDGYIAGYEAKASALSSVQPQSEGGLQWVCATDEVPSNDTPIPVKIDGIYRIGNFFYERGDIAFYVRGGADWVIPKEKFSGIFWLKESASPSTANTEEGATITKEEILRKVKDSFAQVRGFTDWEQFAKKHKAISVEVVDEIARYYGAKLHCCIEEEGVLYETNCCASKEQQIYFAEWAGAEGFHYADGCWYEGVGFSREVGGTEKLHQRYELFLTETKQQ